MGRSDGSFVDHLASLTQKRQWQRQQQQQQQKKVGIPDIWGFLGMICASIVMIFFIVFTAKNTRILC